MGTEQWFDTGVLESLDGDGGVYTSVTLQCCFCHNWAMGGYVSK